MSPINSGNLTPFKSIPWIVQKKSSMVHFVYFVWRDMDSWQNEYLFMLSLAHPVSRFTCHYQQQDHLWSTVTTAPVITLEGKDRFIQW